MKKIIRNVKMTDAGRLPPEVAKILAKRYGESPCSCATDVQMTVRGPAGGVITVAGADNFDLVQADRIIDKLEAIDQALTGELLPLVQAYVERRQGRATDSMRRSRSVDTSHICDRASGLSLEAEQLGAYRRERADTARLAPIQAERAKARADFWAEAEKRRRVH